MEEVISKILTVPLSIWITCVIAVISIAIALTIVEKRLKEKRLIQEKEENSNILEIKKLRKSTKPVREKLVLLNKLSKELFKEEFGIDSRTTFSELSEESKKFPTKVSGFSKEMASTYYQEETLTEEKLNYLIDSLLKIKSPDEKKEKVVKAKSIRKVKRRRTPIVKTKKKSLVKIPNKKVIKKKPKKRVEKIKKKK